MSHSDESPLTDHDVLSSDSPNQDNQQANLDVPSSNPDVPSSDQDTTTAPTQERRGVSEVSGKLSSLLSVCFCLKYRIVVRQIFKLTTITLPSCVRNLGGGGGGVRGLIK